MAFDWTISIGAIIQLIGMAAFGLVVVVGGHWRLRLVETKLDGMKSVLETLARQDERLRSQDERLSRQEKLLDEMRHGEGFIYPLMRGERSQ